MSPYTANQRLSIPWSCSLGRSRESNPSLPIHSRACSHYTINALDHYTAGLCHFAARVDWHTERVNLGHASSYTKTAGERPYRCSVGHFIMGGNTPRAIVPRLPYRVSLFACQAFFVLGKHPLLPLRVFDALARYVEVFGLNLYADELAPEIHASHASCAGTHEGIERQSIRDFSKAKHPLH